MRAGRRSPLGDALQYLVNKLVNKPGQERRWVAVGLGAHPEPRVTKPTAPVPAPPPAAMTNGSAPALRPRALPRPRPACRRSCGLPDVDERTLVVEDDPAFDAAARAPRGAVGELGTRLRGGDARGCWSAGAC